MEGLLVFFHCPSNTGYAIESYERSFFSMATSLLGDPSRVHFSFRSLERGHPLTLPEDFPNVVEFDPGTRDPAGLARIAEYIRDHEVGLAFGVDQPPRSPCYRAMRKAGVRRVISYWGAPMSSLNSGLRLFLKRVQVRTSWHSPDHYIFESQAMARTATHGRGIPSRRTSVVYLGVDAEKYRPDARSQGYLLKEFGIPSERKVLVFSGHMEERKGVRVLMAAAQELVDVRGRRDVHFLLLGNRDGEERPFLDLISDSLAREHVTFGGYRGDVPLILPNCHLGAIASTGWDSFTVSALEMASSGLPLLVSELQGLVETVDPGTTGFTFPPGDAQSLANLTEGLLDDEEARSRISAAARRRVLDRFTTEKQVQELVSVCRSVYGNPGAT